MFSTDLSGQLASQRAAGLLADADRVRRGRQALASWRPARFVEPTADLSRVAPAPAPAGVVQLPRTDRAA